MAISGLRSMMLGGLAACTFTGSAVDTDASRGKDATVDTPPDVEVADAALDAPANPITLAQACSKVALAGGSTIACTTANPQTAGNTNIVIVDWGTNATLKALSDTAGNTYVASGVSGSSDITSVLYYATITHGGPNVVTATLSATATIPKVRVLEYVGLSTTSPFIIGTAGSGPAATMMTVGPVVTSSPHALILAAARPQHTGSAVPPLVARDNSDGDLVEDEEVRAAGSYSASAMEAPAGTWVMLVAAFRGL